MPIPFRRLGLAVQVFDLFFDLLKHIHDASEIFLGVFNAGGGFAATLFVLRNAGCFFQKHSHFFGLRFDQPRNHALFNDRIAARPEPGPKEYTGNVLTSTFRAIQKIVGNSVPGDLASNRDLGILRVLPLKRGLVVIEQ